MASEKKNLKIETDLKVDDVAQGDMAETANPVRQITNELAAVAQGGSATNLRALVSNLMPGNREEAEKYVAVLLRLRQAAEAAHQAATEAYSAVKP